MSWRYRQGSAIVNGALLIPFIVLFVVFFLIFALSDWMSK